MKLAKYREWDSAYPSCLCFENFPHLEVFQINLDLLSAFLYVFLVLSPQHEEQGFISVFHRSKNLWHAPL